MEPPAAAHEVPDPGRWPAARVLQPLREAAMFLVDAAGRVASWNEGVTLLLGWPRERWTGLPLAALFLPEDVQAGRPEEELARALDSGRSELHGWLRRADGERLFAHSVLTRVDDATGRALGCLCTLRDETAPHRAERERLALLGSEAQARERAENQAAALATEVEAVLLDAQRARAEAEQAQRARTEFLATLSHELRTPLTAIIGWAQVLEHGVFDPETVRHGLAAISRNARIQMQLIDELLDLNRLDRGQLRLDLQRLDLGGVVAAAIDSALPAASAKGIGLRTVFAPEPCTVHGDAARLQQVVASLLSNAIKFTPEGGQVSLRLAQAGTQARLEVSDTGQGIATEFLPRLFDGFAQQDGSTTRSHGGLGLGLATVRQLVHLHGGEVHAHSAGPGRGASFTVVLPALPQAGLAQVRAAPVQPLAAAREDTPLEGISVLLVDDEPDVRSTTSRLLEEAGAEVFTADCAEQGLAMLQRHHPRVLLSDIGMPRVDGYELMRRVRALSPASGGSTPAAAFTAFASDEDRQRALEVGFQMHLIKPVSPGALFGAVTALLGRSPAA